MTDILERAKAAAENIERYAYDCDFGEARLVILELIAEVEAKQANNEYLQKMTEEAQGIMQESQLLLCKEANEAEQLQNEVERLRSLNESLMENGNDLRTRCQKAEARIKELEEANRNIDKRRDEMAAFIERLEAAFLEAKRCPTCNGAGKLIDVVISRNLGRVESERVCPLCEGKWEEKAREALEEIKTGGAMSNSVDICPFDDDLTCPLDYHTCEIYRERMEEEQ